MRRPGALLELQLPPLDLEVIALAVQLFQRDKQLTRTMLAINGPGRGAERQHPEQGNRESQIAR